MRTVLVAASLPVLVAGGLLAVGCSKPATQSYECRCDYVTDTDVPGMLDVRVCVSDTADPAPFAAECAQAQGVGHVNTCTCPGSAEACAGAVCEQAAARAPASAP